MCRNKPNHTWPRAEFEQRLLAHNGTREITTCNDCLATRIKFSIDQPDGSVTEETVVVEPPEQKPAQKPVEPNYDHVPLGYGPGRSETSRPRQTSGSWERETAWGTGSKRR